MSSLDIQKTTLAGAPYFDDFDETKNFHRVLFRPAVAVQARELTQLQTVLQNQVERFADHVFQDGSIVQGCSVEYVPDLEYISVADQFVDNTALSTIDAKILLGNTVIIGETSGVQATVFSAIEGYEAQDPSKIFIRYTAAGKNGEREFEEGELITFYKENETYVEQVVLSVANATGFSAGLIVEGASSGSRGVIASANVATNQIKLKNVRRQFEPAESVFVTTAPATNTVIGAVGYDVSNAVGTIRVLESNGSFAALGDAYGAVVTDGIIYHKGHFIRVEQQAVVVNPSSDNPSGYLLGFETSEEVITDTSDPSLNDNALGSTNFNAPGAHRLKLTPVLTAKLRADLTEDDKFFPIAEFSDSGAVFERTDPEYARLGDEIAKRTYEESGHYIVKPFGVSTDIAQTDADQLLYKITPGLAYVKGRRVELKNQFELLGRRGVDTTSYEEQLLYMEYGNFIEVNELRGFFPVENSPSVSLYGTAQAAITSGATSSSAPTGSAIGTANVRNIVYVEGSGEKGTPAARYRVYLFNIKMNSGASFSDVRSVYYNGGASDRAFADVFGDAVLQQASASALLFDLGADAVKTLRDAANNNITNYYYTAANTTASLTTGGIVSFSIPSGGGQVGFGTSLSADAERFIELVLTANATTTSLGSATGAAANGTHSTISAAGIDQQFFAGEYIVFNGAPLLVTGVSTGVVTALGAASVGSFTYARRHVAGSVISLGSSNRQITGNDGSTVTLSLGSNYTASAGAKVRVYARQNSGSEIKKKINRSTAIKINTANNVATNAGPWCLGLPDVLAVRRIYREGNESIDLRADFALDAGQQDTHYELAQLKYAPGANAAAYASANLIVEVDHFSVDTSIAGQGFFSIDSYPVDDSVSADLLTKVRTTEIPTYRSTNLGKEFDLRDAVDFRPYKSATATITQSVSSATVNPPTTNSFDALTTTFNPYPGSNFECNFTHFLPRKDLLVLNPTGTFSIVEGVPSLTPKTPVYSQDSLILASIDVPAYPSLADTQRALGTYSQRVKVSTLSHKRYTMKDISTLEQRIQRLEYYTSLSLLEKSAADMTILDGTGLDRFKNGFFVDPFNSHAFGRTEDANYRVAIDTQRGYARPFFQPEFFELEVDDANSTGVVKRGNSVVMSFTEVPYIEQEFAGTSRSVKPVVPSFKGTLILNPRKWSQVETLAAPVSVAANDRASESLAKMETPVFPSVYGSWRKDQSVITQPGFRDQEGFVGTASPADTALVSTGVVSGDDNSATDATVQSMIRAKVIGFRAVGLKPGTRHYAFIDAINVSQNAAPALAPLGFDPSAGATPLVRREAWGSELLADSRGEIIGQISIPEGKFGIGNHTVKITSDFNGSLNESYAQENFAVAADVLPPPPPVVILPPQTSDVVLVPGFTVSGNTSAAFDGTHTLTFTNTSTVKNGSITSYSWSFGTGANTATATGAGPHVVSYSTSKSVQDIDVSLTVTATGGVVKTFTSKISLYKLPEPPRSGRIDFLVVGPGGVTGSSIVEGTGSVVVDITASIDATAGGSFVWNVTGSTANVAEVISTGAGSAQNNNRIKLTLAANTNQTRALSVQATHSSGNTKTTALTLKVVPTYTVPVGPPVITRPPIFNRPGGGDRNSIGIQFEEK